MSPLPLGSSRSLLSFWLLLSCLVFLLGLLPSGVSAQNYTCSIGQMFSSSTKACQQEYLQGEERGAMGCFRTADCLGMTCKSPLFPYTVYADYNPCSAEVYLVITNTITGNLTTTTRPLAGSITVGELTITFTVIESNAAFVNFTVSFKIIGFPVSFNVWFGNPNCIWDQAYCYQIPIIVCSVVFLGVCPVICCILCCVVCCRRRRASRKIILSEPLLPQGGDTSIQSQAFDMEGDKL